MLTYLESQLTDEFYELILDSDLKMNHLMNGTVVIFGFKNEYEETCFEERVKDILNDQQPK